MQKVGLYLLLALLALATVFALLPARDGVAAKTGATLQDVELTLYAARDPNAIWRFKAARVTNDPLSSTTELSDLSGGERLLREHDSQGRFTGRETLDATITAPKLTIDGQDDLLTDQAKLHLVKECTDIQLIGMPDKPVKIQQGIGFSAPKTEVNGPAMHAKIADLQMDFDTTVLASGRMELIGELDATETCRDGQRVPIQPKS